jgi:hypothetical protein
MSNELQSSNSELSNRQSSNSQSVQPAGNDEARLVSRRWLMLKAGIALNGFVGVVLAVPILR